MKALLFLLAFVFVGLGSPWAHTSFSEASWGDEPSLKETLIQEIQEDLIASRFLLETLQDKEKSPLGCQSIMELQVVLNRLYYNLEHGQTIFSHFEPLDDFTGESTNKTLRMIALNAQAQEYKAIVSWAKVLARSFKCSPQI